MKRWFVVGTLAAVALSAAALGTYAWQRAHERPTTLSAGIAGARMQMIRDLKQLGPARAYAAFKQDYARQEFSVQHNAAHLFGTLLYDEEGMAGIGTCDADFNYGCYHGFIIEAIAEGGFAAVGTLEQACERTPTPSSCEHGIGHGIFEYLGHIDLPRALAACGTTNVSDPLAGCYTGVFMEYNEPIVFNDAGVASTQARQPMQGKPYDVCPTLVGGAARACYYSLPQWWRLVYSEDFASLGARCAGAPAAYQNDCFAGIGNIAAPTEEFDAAKTIAACNALPAIGRSTCLVYAAGSTAQAPGQASAAAQVCAAAESADRRACGS